MALSEIDRNLLERCLQRKPRAWEDFVDRFLGLIVHVVDHTTKARNIPLGADERDDLCAEVLLTLIRNDFAVLRHFRGQSSLATYLTVIARRVVVHEILKRVPPQQPLSESVEAEASSEVADALQRIEDREEIEQLLQELPARDAEIVRMYHLEGKSYREISQSTGVAQNTIGPVLSRARTRMRQASVDQPTA
ncbi:MAG: sigma-70 family RNA polymerase sigma factor [Planctomycetaceae bacterium]|nr:sigma-70 family RNA polymerase sigma factor [Planctomycetaceae bacterium]